MIGIFKRNVRRQVIQCIRRDCEDTEGELFQTLQINCHNAKTNHAPITGNGTVSKIVYTGMRTRYNINEKTSSAGSLL